MKMTLLKAGMCILAAGASVGAVAQATPGWTTPSVVESFITTERGLTIILPTSGNPTQCVSASWAFIASTEPNYALISSTILTAFSQGKSIRVWQSDCHPDGQARFVAVWIDR
jgi:hypothetical protein